MSGDLAPATAVLVGGVSGLLAADVWLMANDHAPVTEVFRTKAGGVFLGLLAGHVLGVLGPVDPFRALGSAAESIQRRRMPPGANVDLHQP